METWTDGIAYQEGDHACLKPTREAGRITVTVGGVGYVLMDGTNESELFAAYGDPLLERKAFLEVCQALDLSGGQHHAVREKRRSALFEERKRRYGFGSLLDRLRGPEKTVEITTSCCC